MTGFWKALATAILFTAVAPRSAHADGEEVIVIYNSRVPESRSVAEYYAKLRDVPAKQVFSFNLTTNDTMSRAEFRDALQRPLAKALEKSKLWQIRSQTMPGTNGKPGHVLWKVTESKIRYAVLCYGVPIRIAPDNGLKENGTESLRAELRRNEAAVDNELACLPAIEQDVLLAGPLRNPLYAVTNAALLHPTNGLLMVTRLDGPSASIARGLVDKALEAERDGMWGRAYFDLRNASDPSMKQGDDWIRGAAEICRNLGFETSVDTNGATFPASFPMSHIAVYCGWYDEHVSGPFAQPKVEFMPGAFAYHLHSFSAGELRSPSRNWVGPLLAKGATISMGSVNEPYLGGTPDVAMFVMRLIFNGFTFGEAAYAGQSTLSWQTAVVGDPLYRPFGKPPQKLHEELERKNSALIEWSHLRVVNLNLAQKAPLAELVEYLEHTTITTNSAVLTEKLADLYAAQGKPSSAAAAYERALTLDPSPQQKIRLRLTLGEKLAALNRDESAFENYQKVLQESPAYPGKLSVFQKLLPLAQKLGKKDDATKYEEQIRLLAPPPPPKP